MIVEKKSWSSYQPRRHRFKIGVDMRHSCPLESHAHWDPPVNRKHIVDHIVESNEGRIPSLIPIRHGRMGLSPFTFYRGTALIMASDLALTPSTGIYVQACGDAHLSNFGGFATPERHIIFSINDLDETHPAPWEWDLKRLTTSFVLACKNNQIDDIYINKIVLNCVQSYREHMALYSKMEMMELWHYALTADMLIENIDDPKFKKRSLHRVEKIKNRSKAVENFPQFVRGRGATVSIKDDPPFIFHWEGHAPGEINEEVAEVFENYCKSLPPGYGSLLNRFDLKDIAIKVVGVGSVGTACWVILLMTGDGEFLFLQAKQANKSVLEPFTKKSVFINHGERIVEGYRLMQPYSDPFLGWTKSKLGKHYFIRQLRDIKINMRIEKYKKKDMKRYADWCGNALALSHARSGDAAMISGYLGEQDTFDKAIAEFSFRYTDQNEKDYAVFMDAIKSEKLKAFYEKKY